MLAHLKHCISKMSLSASPLSDMSIAIHQKEAGLIALTSSTLFCCGNI